MKEDVLKRKIIYSLIAIIAVLGLVTMIGVYVYDVVYNHTPFAENLFRVIAVSLVLLATLLKSTRGGYRNGLDLYEKTYANELGCAFQNKPMARKKAVVRDQTVQ